LPVKTIDNSTGATLETLIGSEYANAKNALEPLLKGFTEKESLLSGVLPESQAANFKSQVTDNRLSTLVLERASRVMAQVPTGKVQALTKKDAGPSIIANLGLTRYYIPNSNAQMDHLTKLRMIDVYSQVYGVCPVIYDQSITENYIGPDFWILPIRDWMPQPGKTSIADSDYCFVRTTVSLGWVKSRIGKEGWDAKVIKRVIALAENGGKAKTSRPIQQQTAIERKREANFQGDIGNAAQIELVTRYGQGSDGKWITFFPEYSNWIGRNIDNQHADGNIPIVLKHHYPLQDSIYGLGAFERGKSLQYAMNSLINLYLDGVKMSIFPPLIIQQNGVVANTIQNKPNAKWIETEKNSIRRHDVSPSGLQTFQSTYQFMTGSLMSQNGTTDTSQTVENTSDPSYGRTPAALALQKQRESAADNWDRYMMERFIETLYERSLNLLAGKQEKDIILHLFESEIKQLQDADQEKIAEVFESKRAGKLTITPDGKNSIKGMKFKYMIDPSTTMQQDQAAEHATLGEIISNIVAAPQILQAMEQFGKRLDIGELYKRWIISSGTADWEKIIVDIKSPAEDKQKASQGLPNPSDPLAQLTAAAGAPAPGAPTAQPVDANGAPTAPDAASLIKSLTGQTDAPVEPPKTIKEMMTIKFESLPEDTKRAILKTDGLPADEPFPAAANDLLTHAKTAQVLKDVHAPSDPVAALTEAVRNHPATPQVEAPVEPAPADPQTILANTQDPAVSKLRDHLMSHIE
jgi:hypothetical protein